MIVTNIFINICDEFFYQHIKLICNNINMLN